MKYFILQYLQSEWKAYDFYVEENIKSLTHQNHEVFLLQADFTLERDEQVFNQSLNQFKFNPEHWAPNTMPNTYKVPYAFARVIDNLIHKGHTPNGIEYSDFDALGYFLEVEKQQPSDPKYHCKSICTWYGSHFIRNSNNENNLLLEEMESFVYESADIHFATHPNIIKTIKSKLNINNTKPIILRPPISYDFPWKKIQIETSEINIVISDYQPEIFDQICVQLDYLIKTTETQINFQIITHPQVNESTAHFQNWMKNTDAEHISITSCCFYDLKPRKSELYYFPCNHIRQLDYKLFLMSKGQLVLENAEDQYSIWKSNSSYQICSSYQSLNDILATLDTMEMEDWVKNSLFELHQEYRAERNTKMKVSILKAVEDHHKSNYFPNHQLVVTTSLRTPQINYENGVLALIKLDENSITVNKSNIKRHLEQPIEGITEYVILHQEGCLEKINALIEKCPIPILLLNYNTNDCNLKWIDLINISQYKHLLLLNLNSQCYPNFIKKAKSMLNQYQNISSISSWGAYNDAIDYSTSPRTPYVFEKKQSISPFILIDLNKVCNGSHLNLPVFDQWYLRHYLLNQMQNGYLHFVIPEVLFESQEQFKNINFNSFDQRNYTAFYEKNKIPAIHNKKGNFLVKELYHNNKNQIHKSKSFDFFIRQIKKIKNILS